MLEYSLIEAVHPELSHFLYKYEKVWMGYQVFLQFLIKWVRPQLYIHFNKPVAFPISSKLTQGITREPVTALSCVQSQNNCWALQANLAGTL